jgi:hypothetical protein
MFLRILLLCLAHLGFMRIGSICSFTITSVQEFGPIHRLNGNNMMIYRWC